ncbi:transposase [Nonomuraea sediminis]|uniref:transposase n=1 Tax=Nonomuraea sediminis TaxID=2835864 RepID=UPI001BDD8327
MALATSGGGRRKLEGLSGPELQGEGGAEPVQGQAEVARVYARITDRRRDHLRRVTTRLVRENQMIAVAKLPVRAMVNNHRLARHLRGLLAGTAQHAGAQDGLVRPDADGGPLSMRSRTREEAVERSAGERACGAILDRDMNAARDVLTAGLAES